MAESQIHIDLVRLMFRYVQIEFNTDVGHILIDLPDSKNGTRPPKIQEFRPDLYAKTKSLLIIGEAKTESDWDRRHSLEQYQTYIDECMANECLSILLIAIPWRFEKSLKSRIKHNFQTENQYNVQIKVISDMWSP